MNFILTISALDTNKGTLDTNKGILCNKVSADEIAQFFGPTAKALIIKGDEPYIHILDIGNKVCAELRPIFEIQDVFDDLNNRGFLDFE